MNRTAYSEVIDLARRGQLDNAAVRVQRALQESPEPGLFALAGLIESRRDRHASAATHLRRAHDALPADVVIRANLAEALYRSGDEVGAVALATDDAIAADQSLRLARMAAAHAQANDDFERAVELYRGVVARDARDWSSWNNLGNALIGARAFPEAVEALDRAVALAPDAAPIRVNLGNALADAGEGERCEKVLRDAARDFPIDPQPLLALFRLLREAGREDEAYEAIAEAAARAPREGAIRSDYGQEAARRNEYAIAEREFEAALALIPDLGPPFVGLASVFERVNREHELVPLQARAIAAGVDDQSLAYMEALLHKRAGSFEEALEALDRSGEVVVPARRYHLRGTLLDRLGRHDEAWSEFAAMNAHWQDDPSRPRERAADYRAGVVGSTALMHRDWAATWPPVDVAGPYHTPEFLVGFPRSGTTLLDTMLMADPDVVVLEEEPFISQIDVDIGSTAALPDLDNDAVTMLRTRYFDQVDQLAPLRPESRIVDKHPMHLNKAATIRRLFPDARFILALRHPCDVLLSCVITNFRANNAMANFLDLEDAATLYDHTFTHWESTREALDLPVHTIVYERLVADRDRELRPLFDWLDLAWPGDDHDHRVAARERGAVATASYSQVTEPLYTRSAGRWRNYERHLAPIFPVIAPWVEKFGYSLDDDRVPGWPEPHIQ